MAKAEGAAPFCRAGAELLRVRGREGAVGRPEGTAAKRSPRAPDRRSRERPKDATLKCGNVYVPALQMWPESGHAARRCWGPWVSRLNASLQHRQPSPSTVKLSP